MLRLKVLLFLAVLALALFGVVAGAGATPPLIVSTAVTENSVTATSATLAGSINPNGSPTTYRFEYLTEAAYLANLGAVPPRDPFSGATLAPTDGAGSAGVGTNPNRVGESLTGLPSLTSFRFRLVATNLAGETATSVARPFATGPPTNAFALLDRRGWEMVSPIEKAGGAVQPPGAIAGGGVFQAAAGGGAMTFSSADSFGVGAGGAPTGSQYVATRTGGGWVTSNITTPLLSGSYGSDPDGVPYQLFSGDLGFGLLSNGERCRGQVGGECPVANPALPGTAAPGGYRNYYRRTASGAFESVLSPADLAHSGLSASQFEIRLVAATPDLAHLVLSSCAALTDDAIEDPAPGGCDPNEQNLYEWSGGGLSLINVLPGETTGAPGARIGAPSGAVSANGARVYFTLGGSLYLREGEITKTVSSAAGAEFAAASTDGSIAYVIESGGLERFSAPSGTLTPVDPGPEVEGALGSSADGSRIYYAKGGAVFLAGPSGSTQVAAAASPTDWPAATGTARVSADGSHLLFLSAAELTGYPSEGATEVFLYGPIPGSGTSSLSCVSCNPSGERPQGDAAIPGAFANGSGAGSLSVYKPRDLSADGNRAFFETTDSLVSQDTNKGVADVYEWEAAGEGSCTSSGGCVQLISGGRDLAPSYFLDADAGGGEAFFLTAASLYPLDPGSYDVYVAREGGGFPVPEAPIPCVADACQVLPEAPEDRAPGTLATSSGNPALKIAGAPTGKHHKKPKRKRPRHGKKSKKARKHHSGGSRGGGKGR
jgi:hypothetical protein